MFTRPAVQAVLVVALFAGLAFAGTAAADGHRPTCWPDDRICDSFDDPVPHLHRPSATVDVPLLGVVLP